MEITLTPDVITKPNTDTISRLENYNKRQQVSQTDQELINKYDDPVSEEEITRAIEDINKTLALHNTRLEFSIHDRTKEIMVKVVDEKTGELIREVPPKKVLDMVAMAWDEIGLLVDEKA